MNDVREQLERAVREAPPVSVDPTSLHERREARARAKRITTLVAAAAIGLLPIALGLVIIGGHGGSSVVPGGSIGVPTQDLQLKPGEYYFVRFDAGYGACESWWAPNESGKLANADPPSPGGSCWGAYRGDYGPGEFSSDSGPVAYLSTDPSTLEQQLRARVQPDGASPEPYGDWGGPIEWGLIRSIGELLNAPDVTPAQKAALMEVAANLDGVQVDPSAQDPTGRPAIELTTDTEGSTNHWWFDPESHQLLAMTGGAFGDVVVQAAGVVGSTDSTDLDRSFIHEIHT
jgi:hypothetical protein